MSLVIIGLIVSTLIIMVQGGKEARELGVMSLVVGLSLESNNVAQIIMISGIVVLIVGEQDMETVVLGVMGIIGLIIVGTTTGLLTMYLGIEIVGLSFYILAGRERKGAKSTEAGMKYFVLGAISSGILLMGITKVYAETGTTDIELIGTVSKTMVEVGILFKVGAAPFHMWVADVYEGAGTIITTYFAVVPKVAYMGILMKLGVGKEIVIIGIISIIVGSLGAINQTKIKRMLAYSGIGHVGFMLIGLGIGTYGGMQATLIYMVIYIVMTINSFTIVLSQGIQKIAELRGLARRNGVLGMTVGIGMMSIAGIPPLGGFYNKYQVLEQTVEAGEIEIAIIAVVMSVISSYYYVRLIRYANFKDKPEVTVETKEVTLKVGIVLGVTTYIIMTIMFYPSIIWEITVPSTLLV